MDLDGMDLNGGERRQPVDGVTVIGDFLRPDGQGNPGGVDRPAAWLHSAVKRQIGLASGLPVGLLSATAMPALAHWVAGLRPPNPSEMPPIEVGRADAVWAACHAALPDDPAWTAAIARLVVAPLRGKFCVGYELPPYLRRLLDQHCIPYVDIRLHPIRFLDDLIFAVRASDPATHAALAGLAMPEAEVVITAGLREAMCRHIGQSILPAGTLAVIGQRPFDATQIVDGRFFEAAHHRSRIAAICAGHPGVVLKPHPHERAHSLLTVAAEVGGRVIGVLGDNIYRLLAMPEITAILTVSSSVAYEAAYFGKTVHILAPLPIRLGWRGEPMADCHASLGDVVLCPDFWRLVLAPHAAVSSPDGVRLAAKPNRLRIALDSFWNYNEIDSDRLPARAATAPA